MSLNAAPSQIHTLAELVERLGGIPLERIRVHPAVGQATERDVVEVEQLENRLCELVEGTLVEKAMGFRESLLAAAIAMWLNQHVLASNLGIVTGADGMIRLFPGLVRIPDVAFTAWASLPEGRIPAEPIPEVAPDLAVEVLSSSNTPQEMARKRTEYFTAGVKLVWIVDPALRTVAVFRSPTDSQQLGPGETLSGDPVLPSFAIAVSDLFFVLDRQAP